MAIPDCARRAGVNGVLPESRGDDGSGADDRDVHAYVCDTRSIDVSQYRSLVSLLSPDERMRADALWRTDDRRDYAAAHALLRRVLAIITRQAPEHLAFDKGESGKPFLTKSRHVPAPPHFSLSHTHDLVACAISTTCVVGIDVEITSHAIDAQRLATRYFTADEAAAVGGCAADEQLTRFCELWTLKEALLKAAGIGRDTTVDSVSFRVDEQQVSLTRTPPGMATDWAFVLRRVGRTHVLAVAAGPRATCVRVTYIMPEDVLAGSIIPTSAACVRASGA